MSNPLGASKNLNKMHGEPEYAKLDSKDNHYHHSIVLPKSDHQGHTEPDK